MTPVHISASAHLADEPRPYDLRQSTELVRLHRELLGYLRTCQNDHHGTDTMGREYAIEALRELLGETGLGSGIVKVKWKPNQFQPPAERPTVVRKCAE